MGADQQADDEAESLVTQLTGDDDFVVLSKLFLLCSSSGEQSLPVRYALHATALHCSLIPSLRPIATYVANRLLSFDRDRSSLLCAAAVARRGGDEELAAQLEAEAGSAENRMTSPTEQREAEEILARAHTRGWPIGRPMPKPEEQ